MVAIERWCRVTLLDSAGDPLASWEMAGPRPPDMAAVDEVARLALVACRLRGRLALSDVSDGMRELLVLAGLSVEMDGQAELREKPLAIEEREEEAHPGDLPA